MPNELNMKKTILSLITPNYLILWAENSTKYLAENYVKLGFSIIVVVSDA
jgi:hypothetical protein